MDSNGVGMALLWSSYGGGIGQGKFFIESNKYIVESYRINIFFRIFIE
jgi:hypothetical protein